MYWRRVADLDIDGAIIKSCRAFKYLGSVAHRDATSMDATCLRHTETKIVRDKQMTRALHGIKLQVKQAKEEFCKVYNIEFGQ